ncbi:Gfo/Idh/MocA family oxidoreductase [Amycolatopsis viridis]|uniref:Myo-inositol 2-dehydrogenase/D-chiro-inositol 1-dehydrogenase n=1 Tax=Amycolatopsis viridis TaxID=185678 RepID=A0ABX0STP9_9PSEU|nr:Gfo/Idh/MocA family oxidoreductase [Amycolatopsis viridis]NIH78895.1 myo-inositol 2-dehydrogenase/D-chiro-inositol 1-dehydrogenase [Amycolatopsis viridis]
MTDIALLGFGRIAQVHAKAIASGNLPINVRAVADANPDARAAAAQLGAKTFESVDELLSAGLELDAALVASSTPFHVEHTTLALDAGLHVLCEKPLSEDVQEVRHLTELAAEKGLVLRTAFNRRFDPLFRDLKSRIGTETGPVRSVHIISRDPFPPPPGYPRSAGSMLRDMTIHDFDTARYLVDDDIVAVTARGTGTFDTDALAVGDTDTVFLILEMARGTLIGIDNCRATSYGFDQRIEVHGEAGTLHAGNEALPQATRIGAAGFTTPRLVDFFPTRYAQSYIDQLSSFGNAIAAAKAGAAPDDIAADGRDALQALQAALAGWRSIVEGRRVTLEEVE